MRVCRTCGRLVGISHLADRSGAYGVYDSGEPQGRYRLTVVELRDARTTASLLAARARERGAAASWLRQRAARLPDAAPLLWVGGVFQPGSLPSEAFRPFKLVDDFDGIFYLPKVSADQIYSDRQSIPPRRR